MTPVLNPPRSVFGTFAYGLVHLDRNVLHNWDLDSITKRVIATAALLILASGAVPFITPVHGEPKADIDYEIQHIQDELKELRGVPTQMAVMQQELSVMAQWHKEDQDLKSKLVDGFLGVIGAVFLAIFVWWLNQLGITIGKKEKSLV